MKETSPALHFPAPAWLIWRGTRLQSCATAPFGPDCDAVRSPTRSEAAVDTTMRPPASLVRRVGVTTIFYRYPMPPAEHQHAPSTPSGRRTFCAANGTLWTVSREEATTTSTEQETACASLLFEEIASGERRWLAEVPRDWADLTARRLDLLRRLAQPTPPVARPHAS